MICQNYQFMIFVQFSFRAMEQIRTVTLLNPHSVGGRLIVVDGAEAQEARSALALQVILKIATYACKVARPGK